MFLPGICLTLSSSSGTTPSPTGESVRGFFTPATLFLVVNLVIDTIALTARSHQRRRLGGGGGHEDDVHGNNHHHRGPPLHQEDHQYYEEQQQYVPAPLARTSSVLDRIRSIGLYRFRSGDFPPEYSAAAASDSQDAVAGQAPGDGHYARSWSEPAPVREKKRAAPPSRMKKSTSEARKAEVAPPAPARVVHQAAVLVEEEEEDVDVAVGARVGAFAQPPAQQESRRCVPGAFGFP